MPKQDTDSIQGQVSQMTRRGALTAAVAGTLTAQLPAKAADGGGVTAELIRRAAEKNAAFMRGDMDRWASLVHIASDFTLMQPFGGPPSHRV